MCVDAIATLVSSVAALLATFAAFLAIVEMRLQRRSSYRPDLAVTDTSLDFLARRPGLPRVCRTTPEGKPEGSENDGVSLDCFNVGLGPAKQVVGTWRFDLHAFLDHVAALRIPNGPHVLLQHGDTLRLRFPEGWEAFHSLSAQLKFERPFLLPANTRAEPYKIPVPPAYIHLLALAVHLTSLHSSEGDPPFVLVGDLPGLSLRLDFHDLGEDSRAADFEIEPQFTMLTSSSAPPQEGSSIGHTALHITRVRRPKSDA